MNGELDVGRIHSDDWLGLHCGDARHLAQVVPPESVDLLLTSPPYANLKDYGSLEQIGFGQSIEDYFRDMRGVLHACFRVAKPTATLWLVSDVFKENGEIVNLPAHLALCASKAGWKLQDIIIWHKTKTLPWSHHGRLRKIFEYIYIFAKSKNYKYYPDRIRETEGLRQWWIKYPERYNPHGRAPHSIWYFPIPTQGSWGNGTLRHFNPFPTALVERIIDLTTDSEDVVFDPFAGTGTVISQAECMGRRGVGIELSPRFVEQLFPKVRAEVNKLWNSQQYRREERQHKALQFYQLIMRMRKIKLAKQIIRALCRQYNELPSPLVTGIVLDKATSSFGLTNHKLGSIEFTLVLNDTSRADAIVNATTQLCSHPPFSKYGVAVEVHNIPTPALHDAISKQSSGRPSWFVYPANTLPTHDGNVTIGDIVQFCHGQDPDLWAKHGLPPVFSDIEVKSEEINLFID